MKSIEISFSDFSVLYRVGENAEDNDQIVKISDPEDLWFHAKDISSCHVVAVISDMTLTKKDLQKVIRHGSLLCKQHTKKLNTIQNVVIMYTKRKNIERTKTLGCVLTKEWKENIV